MGPKIALRSAKEEDTEMPDFMDTWLDEMTTSALREPAKKLACILAVASYAQYQKRRFWYLNPNGVKERLPHTKVLSISCILTGRPGSYKSETVRMVRRVLDETKQVNVYPHDQVSREYLVTTLAAMQSAQVKATEIYDSNTKTIKIPKNPPPITCTICIEELINFLNRREYVEPLVGALNTLLDQPPSYGAGTQRRQSEIIHRPIINFIGACAPSWFHQLPESLFTGGFAGRCLFYTVPYPRDEDRQPRGQICKDGGEERLAHLLTHGGIPDGDITLDNPTIRIHDRMEAEWGRELAHAIPVLDEWYKRRAIQTTRLAGAIALAHCSDTVQLEYWDEAHTIMQEVEKTLEEIWFETAGSQEVQYNAFRLDVGDKLHAWQELEAKAVRHFRSVRVAQSSLDWWRENDILTPQPGGLWKFKTSVPAEISGGA